MAFAALSQKTRLDVFRLLIKAGNDGLLSGEMGELLKVRQNTMSTNLNILLRSNLIRNAREGRTVRYFADMEGIGEMIDFLLKDCCGGRPEQCQPVIQALCSPGCQTEENATKRRTASIKKRDSRAMTITIYHNPDCGTSRNTLAMIRQAGFEPTIIEYLKTPPSRETLIELIKAMPISTRELLRQKGTPYEELGLDDPALSEEALIDAMMAHPILINRPIVITDKGVDLCRPSEKVLALLPVAIDRFVKEDGEIVSSGKED